MPATTLAKACYSYMFSECIRLIKTPYDVLESGLNFASKCYLSMFEQCISLREPLFVPTVQKTSTIKHVYNYMFADSHMLKVWEFRISDQYIKFFVSPGEIDDMCEQMFYRIYSDINLNSNTTYYSSTN